MSAALLLLLAAVPTGSPPAREAVRLCEEGTGEESLAACRRALALGLSPTRTAAVRRLLAHRLASLERWDELATLLAETTRLAPRDAEAWFRLGSVQLLALGRAEQALDPLKEAARLRPEELLTKVLIGLALSALGRHAEAVTAFEEALRLDPHVLDERPAAKAVFEASRQGLAWP